MTSRGILSSLYPMLTFYLSPQDVDWSSPLVPFDSLSGLDESDSLLLHRCNPVSRYYTIFYPLSVRELSKVSPLFRLGYVSRS